MCFVVTLYSSQWSCCSLFSNWPLANNYNNHVVLNATSVHMRSVVDFNNCSYCFTMAINWNNLLPTQLYMCPMCHHRYGMHNLIVKVCSRHSVSSNLCHSGCLMIVCACVRVCVRVCDLYDLALIVPICVFPLFFLCSLDTYMYSATSFESKFLVFLPFLCIFVQLQVPEDWKSAST